MQNPKGVAVLYKPYDKKIVNPEGVQYYRNITISRCRTLKRWQYYINLTIRRL